jgi:hypothetical protein
MLIINRRPLEHVLAEYTTHFNNHRPHRALHQAAPLRPLPPPVSQPDLHLLAMSTLRGSGPLSVVELAPACRCGLLDRVDVIMVGRVVIKMLWRCCCRTWRMWWSSGSRRPVEQC